MSFVDRLLTIVITATLTSAVWIVAGGSLIENATGAGQRDATRPAEAAPSPTPITLPSPDETGGEGEGEQNTDAGSGPDAAALPALNTETADRVDTSQTASLMIPVLNIRPADLSDTFISEASREGRLHEALDIMAPRGTTVVAAAPGTIERLFSSRAGGNTIFVRSGDRRTIHFYAHLDEYAQGLREGQKIRRGQRLGSVGSTGNASPNRPHLHFAILRTTPDAEWWEPANAVNPYPLLTRDRAS